jgi:hypothetical protein
MMSPLRAALPLIGVAVLLTGCAERRDPLRPLGSPGLSLEWSAARRSTVTGDVIDLTARVTNRGRIAVTYLEGCGATPWRIEIVDPERRNVVDVCECPNHTCVVCLSIPASSSLEPGQSVTRSTTFTGKLEDCAGSFRGMGGRYIASAEFRATVGDGSGIAVSRRLTFDWTAPSP